MKNKFGIVSLIISFIPLIILYLWPKIEFGYIGYLIVVGYGVPFYIVSILVFSIILFFCIRSAIFSLRSAEEFKGYPILAILIVLPFFLIFVFIIFFLIQATVGAYIANYSAINNQKSSQQEQSSQNIQTDIKQTENNRDSDLKTYKNDKYGFQLNYPKDWELQDISYDFNGASSIVVNVLGKIRYDLPNYESVGVRYILQLQFLNNKVIVTNNGFIKSQGAQYVDEIPLINSILIGTQEYKEAQKIIQSVICLVPLVCELPQWLVPITNNMITSFLENIPDKTVGSMSIKKTLRGDIDNDKREDATIIVYECQATCYDNIYVFLNKDSGLISVDTSNVPLSKNIDVLLFGGQVEVRTFDLGENLQMDQMYEVKDGKLVPVAGG